ncbi:MAG: ribonuclease Z, partial [Bacteroidota bacterium]
PRALNVDAIAKFKIDKSQFNNIKNGEDAVLEDGTVVANKKLTLDPPEPKSYAFCSDTLYNDAIVPLIKNATVLYHESTFLESELHLCQKTKHSTAMQAAKTAKQASVDTLILGHYSTRYKTIELFQEEAKKVFANVELADDGKVFDI